MGRRKISIQPITDERNRKVTFVKRKAGLFKKAHELAVLCQVDLAVIILGNNNTKFYEYTSLDINDLLNEYKDENYLHDMKLPSDYGDYKLESRVIKRGAGTHRRAASSASIQEDGLNSSDEEDDDEDDDEESDDDSSTKPPLKKRKNVSVKKESKRSNSKTTNEAFSPSQNRTMPPPPQQQLQQVQQVQQVQQSQQRQQQQQQIHQQLNDSLISQTTQMNIQLPLQSIPQGQNQAMFYQSQNQNQNAVPYQQRSQQMQIPNPYSMDMQSVVPNSNPPRGTFTPQTSHVPLNPYPPYPALQFSPSTPMSNRSSDLPPIGTSPVVPNSTSNQYSNARARTLNDTISSRPILRVETHLTQLQKPHNVSQGDSAITLTAIDTAKNESKSGEGGNTPSSGQKSNSDDSKPAGLGISSNKSTPVSATLPSGLFSLPPPQSSQHHQNSSQLPGSRTLMAGEQTPLTGGLPSRYVPDLFPSPSNFYSNDWNIPFGSGSTPYPNSAGPTNHTLPAINSSNNTLNSGKARLKDKLMNTNTDSPLVQKESLKKEGDKSTSILKLGDSKKSKYK